MWRKCNVKQKSRSVIFGRRRFTGERSTWREQTVNKKREKILLDKYRF